MTWLTTEDVAKRLQVSADTVRGMARRPGGPPFVRLSPRTLRILESAFAEWEAKRQEAAAAAAEEAEKKLNAARKAGQTKDHVPDWFREAKEAASRGG